MDGCLWCYACNLECSHGIYGTVGRKYDACKYRHDERLCAEYPAGSHIYSAMGVQYGSGRSRICHIYFKLRRVPVFFLPAICKTKKDVCLRRSAYAPADQRDYERDLRGRYTGGDSKPSERSGDDCAE